MQKIKSFLFVAIASLSLSLPAFAGVSGLCDCQYIECSPDSAKAIRAMCVWLAQKTTIQVISVEVNTPEEVPGTCQSLPSTIDFSRLPNLNESFRTALIERRGHILCEDLHFF